MKKKYIIIVALIILIIIIAVLVKTFYISCTYYGPASGTRCHIKSSDEGKECSKSTDCPHTKLCIATLQEDDSLKGFCARDSARCVSHFDEKGNLVPRMLMCD